MIGLWHFRLKSNVNCKDYTVASVWMNILISNMIWELNSRAKFFKKLMHWRFQRSWLVFRSHMQMHFRKSIFYVARNGLHSLFHCLVIMILEAAVIAIDYVLQLTKNHQKTNWSCTASSNLSSLVTSCLLFAADQLLFHAENKVYFIRVWNKRISDGEHFWFSASMSSFMTSSFSSDIGVFQMISSTMHWSCCQLLQSNCKGLHQCMQNPFFVWWGCHRITCPKSGITHGVSLACVLHSCHWRTTTTNKSAWSVLLQEERIPPSKLNVSVECTNVRTLVRSSELWR